MAEPLSYEENLKNFKPGGRIPPPSRPAQLCRKCGKILDETLVRDGIDTHMSCEKRELTFSQPATVPGSDHPMRTALIDAIRDADRRAPRAVQVGIGPSEIGGDCDLRLAMRMGGIRAVNRTGDPWAAIVGTAIHAWLESALDADNARLTSQGHPRRWITEMGVRADLLISGTSDVFDLRTGTVIDWKTMGDTAKRKLATDGPSHGYEVQIQTYGLGYYRAGFPVRKVALMFLPRSGLLRDARYYEWGFDPSIAHAAIERVYRIGKSVVELQGGDRRAEMWDQVPRSPSNLCGWCPFFKKGALSVTSRGCPGSSK